MAGFGGLHAVNTPKRSCLLTGQSKTWMTATRAVMTDVVLVQTPPVGWNMKQRVLHITHPCHDRACPGHPRLRVPANGIGNRPEGSKAFLPFPPPLALFLRDALEGLLGFVDLALAVPELGIDTAAGDQGFVIAALDDHAVIQHDDLVGIDDGG